MTKKIKYSYDVIHRESGKVLWEGAPTREMAREEKRFLKVIDGVDAYIRQNIFVHKAARNIR